MLKKLRTHLRRRRLQRRADGHILSFPKSGRKWLVLLIAKAIEAQYGVSGVDPLRPYRYKLAEAS